MLCDRPGPCTALSELGTSVTLCEGGQDPAWLREENLGHPTRFAHGALWL